MLLLVVSLLSAFPARAEAPFSVTLTTTNFGASFLLAKPKNLSDPTHATFTLTNSSQMWYGLEMQATPSSLKLTADDLFENIKGADFAVLGLLPPSDFSDLLQHEPSQLDLAVSFTAPQQYLQVTLDPFDWKAAALDDLGIILQYLGLRNPAFKIGLLKSQVVKAILEAVERSQELTELVNDTVSAGHALPDLKAVSEKLYKVAADLYNLFASVSGRKSLADILYLVVDDVVSKTSLSKVVQNFSLKTIVTAGQIVAFFLEYWSAFGTFLYRAGQLPTVLLQSVESTPPTPVDAYPSLASAYQGMAHNNTFNASGSLILTDIDQDHQVITGKVFWGNGLVGDGTFIGSIDARGTITFMDTFPTIPECCSAITFTGRLSADGSLSGTYTGTPTPGQPTQHGTWQVKPYQPAANPHLGTSYDGMVTNLTVNVTTTLALTNIVQNQQAFSGNMAVGPGLNGTGPITGTIAADGSVTFTLSDLAFRGFLFPDGALSGTYIVTDAAQDGTWQTTPG